MEPGKVARKVLEKIAEGLGQKTLVAEYGREVRHLAYAKDTPPKWATWPTLQTLLTNSIPSIDARISLSFEGGVKH
jgi:hypothetical protein